MTTSTLTTVQPTPRDPRHDVAQQLHRRRAAVLLVGRGEQGAEVGQAGRTEQRVGDRVRDGVGVGVPGETGAPVDRHTTEHERSASSSPSNGCTS